MPITAKGHKESVYALAMNDTGSLLVSGGTEKVYSGFCILLYYVLVFTSYLLVCGFQFFNMRNLAYLLVSSFLIHYIVDFERLLPGCTDS